MRISNKTISLIWKLIIVVVGGVTLVQQSGVFTPTPNPTFIHFFTNLSNMLVVLYFVVDLFYLFARRGGDGVPCFPMLKHALTMAITVTFLVAHFMLGAMLFKDGQLYVPLLILHYVVPIMTILDWLLFDKKGLMKMIEPVVWVILPLIYFAAVLILVGVCGIPMGGFTDAAQTIIANYPYPFIDVDLRGLPAVLATAGILVVAFVVLGYIFVGIDKLSAKLSRKSAD